MKNSNRVILVLGIHRSGTSALTKGLETMGVSLGDIISPDNPFQELCEDLEFHDFNVTMLDSLGRRLRRIVPITQEEIASLCCKGFLKQAAELLRKKTSATNLLALKDPKCSLLLPFWKKVFHECHMHSSFVIALRDPSSVVASNKAYCQIEHEEISLGMYISYLLNCLEHSKGHERILVDYNELLQDPKHQMQRIAKALKLTLHQETLETYCHHFIDSSRCHFQGGKKIFCTRGFYHQRAMEIYEALLPIARDEIPFQSAHIPLKKWKQLFSKNTSLLVLAEKNNFTIQELENTILERQQTIRSLSKTVNKNTHTLAGLCHKLHQRNLQWTFLTGMPQ